MQMLPPSLERLRSMTDDPSVTRERQPEFRRSPTTAPALPVLLPCEAAVEESGAQLVGPARQTGCCTDPYLAVQTRTSGHCRRIRRLPVRGLNEGSSRVGSAAGCAAPDEVDNRRSERTSRAAETELEPRDCRLEPMYGQPSPARLRLGPTRRGRSHADAPDPHAPRCRRVRYAIHSGKRFGNSPFTASLPGTPGI